MNVNDFDFWLVLGQHWNWFWFLFILGALGRSSSS